jgi:hypothetical protein
MVRMIVLLDEETHNGMNDFTVGERKEQWKGIIDMDRRR